MKSALLSLLVLPLFAGAALAQEAGPQQPLPMPPATPAPQDIPYPGVIRLQVDATDTDRHIFHVKETIPVTPGKRITLFYPKWLPGNHSPTGQIFNLAGLIAYAGGQRIEWGWRQGGESWQGCEDNPEGRRYRGAAFEEGSPSAAPAAGSDPAAADQPTTQEQARRTSTTAAGQSTLILRCTRRRPAIVARARRHPNHEFPDSLLLTGGARWLTRPMTPSTPMSNQTW